MSARLSTSMLRRPSASSCNNVCSAQQIRHASLLKRPQRPYTFTQLITLSDGSTYTQRTTSPAPIYKSTKDTRNHPLWQPTMLSLRNVEEDEAGRLRAFREKFGRGWDVEGAAEDEEAAQDAARPEGTTPKAKKVEERDESLMDLISGFSSGENAEQVAIREAKEKAAKKGAK